jgi:hypothetical protein
MYEGPRNTGWPTEDILQARAEFIEEATGGGLGREMVLDTFKKQYEKLKDVPQYDSVILWFDA